MEWLELAGALTATALAQLTYKIYYLEQRTRYLAATIALFIAVPPLAYLSLKHLGVGLVYMSTALTQIMVLGLSRLVLREPLVRGHFISLALIVGGIVLYAL